MKLQTDIQEFSKARGWDKKLFSMYNMLCNLSEEQGEIWNEVKWISEEEDLEQVISLKREELKDGIGDLLWCVARLANMFEVDMYESLQERLVEYEERFPVDKVRGRKANPSLGGFDGKYQGQSTKH